LLYSPIISLIFLFGIYVISIIFESYFILKALFLSLILLFLYLEAEWTGLPFFFAFPCLFLLAKIRSVIKSDNMKWVDDFPSSLSIENNTMTMLMLLGIVFASFFVVDYFAFKTIQL
jgi:hypothetical protein